MKSTLPQNNRFEPTLEEKIGQMLLVGFRGIVLDEENPVFEDLTRHHVGSVILFDYDVPAGQQGRNIVSPVQLQRLTSELQSAASHPLFISIDQEGGQVNRLKPDYGFPPSPSHHQLGESDDLQFTYEQASKIAETLRQSGINLNFAPCVDVNINPENPIIAARERSFSDDPQKVALHAEAFLRAHLEQNISGCPKHFPGHGSSEKDTHLGMADVTGTWSRTELVPYRHLISLGICDMIMAAHITQRHLDPEKPASLSKNILTGLLRGELGFTGIIVSDDLEMGAVTRHFDLREIVESAILAGTDLLTFGKNLDSKPADTGQIIAIILNMLEHGLIDETRIDASYNRISGLKRRMHLWD